MDTVIPIRALGDNFVYLYRYGDSKAFCVDPGDSRSVLSALKEHGLSLTTILLTHHHFDHVGGTNALVKETGCKVIGSDMDRMPRLDSVVEDGESIHLDDIEIEVIETPGHTKTSVCYLVNDKHLFSGDTLFIGGCGRIFEGNVKTMLKSLVRLAVLDGEILVYPGHDYTAENYEFSLSIEADNAEVQRLLDDISAGNTAIPSTILQERNTNIFLRSNWESVRSVLSMPDSPAVNVFAKLRKLKDVF